MWTHIAIVNDFFFFFQAEDGIRDVAVTGDQACALPISSVNRQARAQSPACCKIRFISNWPQSWCPTCTGPASRACSTWTWSGSTVTVERSPSDPTVLFFLLRAFSTHSWISVEEPDRDSCPCNADWSLCASPRQSSAGAGSRLPREQMVRWRGTLAACTELASRRLVYVLPL